MLQFVFSLCRGENEKWAEPLLISLLGLCFGGNRQRLLRHFRRLKHEPVREKATKRLKMFSLAFLLKQNRFYFPARTATGRANRTISVWQFPCMRLGIKRQKFVALFYSRLVTFLRVVSQFSHRLPLAVDRSFLRHRLFMVSAAFNFKRPSFESRKRKRIKATSS